MDTSMTWREAYVMAAGAEPEAPYVPPWVASLIFFFINMTVGIGLRGMARLILPRRLGSLVIDFLCTMEACAYFFENNFVVKYYGYTWLGVAVMAQLYVVARTWPGDAIDNPVKAFHQFLTGQVGLLMCVVKIAVTAGAGLASYRLARLIWSLDLIEDHHERYYEVNCGSDLQSIWWIGLVIEMAACMSDMWLGLQTVIPFGIVDEFVKYLNATLMIIFGLQTTGMYFNPAMASGHTMGCGETLVWEHLAVYWAGPFIGTALATALDGLVHIDVTAKPAPPSPPKGKKKKKAE